MRLLSLDPGALRCGWAVLESEGSKQSPKILYVSSGIFGLVRLGNYQEYRLLLIESWVNQFRLLDSDLLPNAVVSETVPPTGGTVASIVNRQLALTVITTVQTLSYAQGLEVSQIGASTVKKHIGGSGTASKVKVRNGVLERLPELEHRRPEWTGKSAVFDEVDALAIGLTYLLPKD